MSENLIDDTAQRRISELESLVKQEKQNRADDRTGRTKAERQLRELLLQRNPTGLVGQQLHHVAVVRSCFQDRRGTPRFGFAFCYFRRFVFLTQCCNRRQGVLVPSARAVLQFVSQVQPQYTLDGLAEFSHVWIIFVFHQNTNAARSAV